MVEVEVVVDVDVDVDVGTEVGVDVGVEVGVDVGVEVDVDVGVDVDVDVEVGVEVDVVVGVGVVVEVEVGVVVEVEVGVEVGLSLIGDVITRYQSVIWKGGPMDPDIWHQWLIECDWTSDQTGHSALDYATPEPGMVDSVENYWSRSTSTSMSRSRYAL